MSRPPRMTPPLARRAARLLAGLALTLAAAAGSCSAPPLESRFPLSEPGAAPAQPHLAGTWGRFADGDLVEFLRISDTEEQPFALMLQPLDGAPPLYMTAFATEVAGMTIYNVRRVAGIGDDYTLMARGGCAPYSPAHAPGYMLYWASFGGGQTMSLHRLRLGGPLSPPGDPALRIERHTNARYPDLTVIESEPRALLERIAALEEIGEERTKTSYTETRGTYRRLDDFAGEITIPVPFAERAEQLLSVAQARYMAGDMAGLAAMHGKVARAVACLGPERLDDDDLRSYLTVLVAAGRAGEAMATAEAAAPEDRDELLFAIGHARLRMGDAAEARALEDRIGDAELRDWLAYLRALAAHAIGNREAALAALERLPTAPAEAVPPDLVADLYMALGAPDPAARIRAEAAAEMMDWMHESWVPGERCSAALDDSDLAPEDEAWAGAPADTVPHLIRLDRPEALRRYLEYSVACPDAEEAAEEDELLLGQVWLRDPAIADALTRQADATRAAGEAESMRRDWAAAIVQAAAGRRAEALRLVEAAGAPTAEVLRDSFADGFPLYGPALGATARALAAAGEDGVAAGILQSLFATPAGTLEDAETRAGMAMLAAITLTDPRPTVEGALRLAQFIDSAPDIAEGLAAGDVLSQGWGLPRLAAQRRAVIGNALAQRLLASARDEIDARLAAAEGEEQLSELGLPWLDSRLVIDFLTAPERRAGALLAGAAEETERVDSPMIRVENHLLLAAMLAVMGDPAAALEALALAETAAAEVPATGAHGHSGGGFIDLGVNIH